MIIGKNGNSVQWVVFQQYSLCTTESVGLDQCKIILLPLSHTGLTLQNHLWKSLSPLTAAAARSSSPLKERLLQLSQRVAFLRYSLLDLDLQVWTWLFQTIHRVSKKMLALLPLLVMGMVAGEDPSFKKGLCIPPGKASMLHSVKAITKLFKTWKLFPKYCKMNVIKDRKQIIQSRVVL